MFKLEAVGFQLPNCDFIIIGTLYEKHSNVRMATLARVKYPESQNLTNANQTRDHVHTRNQCRSS